MIRRINSSGSDTDPTYGGILPPVLIPEGVMEEMILYYRHQVQISVKGAAALHQGVLSSVSSAWSIIQAANP